MTICVVWHDMALPQRSKNGTFCQRQLSMCSLTTPKVAVWLSGGTPGSSRYLRYWPRIVSPKTSSGFIGRTARNTFTFSSRMASASKLRGGLHGRERHQLQQVVLEHVAQHADRVVVRRPMADGQVLGGRDLHVVDVVAVPDRLEDAVGESQHQHVLHRLLAQVVVDAIDLVLGKDVVHLAVEFAGAGQIGAEGFFDDDPARPRDLPLASPAAPSWASTEP